MKSNASQNSGENERETAEFGASDPPKTQLGRNLFSTKYSRHNFSLSLNRGVAQEREIGCFAKTRKNAALYVAIHILITHDYPNIPKWDCIISSKVTNEEMVS